MAALVQTIPQQATTITLLQPRPASSSGASQLQSQQQQQQYQMARNTQPHRQSYTDLTAITGYRPSNTPSSSIQPVAPYAFTSTPSLANTSTPPPQPRPNTLPQMKSDSWAAPSLSSSQTEHNPAYSSVIPSRAHFQHAAGSVSTNSGVSVTSSINSARSKDDSSLPSALGKAKRAPRPLSSIDLDLPPITMSMTPTTSSLPSKPSPDRYRRGQRRAEQANVTTLPSTSNSVVTAPSSPSATPEVSLGEKYPALAFTQPNVPELKTSFGQHTRNASADNVPTTDKVSPELAKRYRRRSLGSLDSAGLLTAAPSEFCPKAKSPLGLAVPAAQPQPNSSQAQASVNGNDLENSPRLPSSPDTQPPGAKQNSQSVMPSRSAEVSKRPNSSPLSKSDNVNMDDIPKKTDGDLPSNQTKFQSAAAKRLTEISKKGGKSGKSRLRRALSFSSVAELRGASTPAETTEKTRKQQLDEELGAEQAAIAQKQEASGLGESIYSGQGHFFSGSTDNISVSSTASSASIMLRKMGKGVKRSTRSLVGLFRPKSLHNVSLEPTRVEPMVPLVSRVTVEAQRESPASAIPEVPNSNRAIERNSEDTIGSGKSADQVDTIRSRKSILGGDKERAEVLAAVKKGILKKSIPGGCSPVIRPSDSHFLESPRSSAPSTPRDDRPRSGHRRTDSVMLEGEDYFLPDGRFCAARANSAPVTPQNSAKNISFSPRIQFHDTWPSGEYDRRGDIATCNRLTPLLAQQIKEELNTFKMVPYPLPPGLVVDS
ncbi:bud neck involved protein [Emydomyces testavorans]|uniref:Bud neck involved protein n=1 Tax=Emydomyces testavorans TaxID=2070801 RepID=A0AAF0DAY2_9EURO|nr:bud neck involved protein [Emydomyces testavorans]